MSNWENRIQINLWNQLLTQIEDGYWDYNYDYAEYLEEHEEPTSVSDSVKDYSIFLRYNSYDHWDLDIKSRDMIREKIHNTLYEIGDLKYQIELLEENIEELEDELGSFDLYQPTNLF
jgi:hypothetical protein